jgi:hypothetical protein
VEPLVAAQDDHWIADLAGRQVASVTLDRAVSLRIEHPDGAYWLRIEQPFVVTGPGGRHELDPAGDPSLLGPALAAARTTVQSAVALKSGALELTFDTGSTWRVDPIPRYEAWTLAGPRGLLLVSKPGGELAVWSAVEQES